MRRDRVVANLDSVERLLKRGDPLRGEYDQISWIIAAQVLAETLLDDLRIALEESNRRRARARK